MKYLIAGLGNIGAEYKNTRHNIGFNILDAFAEASNVVFKDKRHAFYSEAKYKGRSLILIKPTTYVNLSGKAIHYWLQKENIPINHLLVLVDDLDLHFGTIRIRPKGQAGGHNGLKNIEQWLETSTYARLRFGIGNDYPKGRQVDYVLSEWDESEKKELPDLIERSTQIIRSFSTAGLERTMNQFNKKSMNND